MDNNNFKNKYRIDSHRLKEWDYRINAAYFITICTKDKTTFLGKIKNGYVCLSKIGTLASQYWQEIPKHFPDVILDEFIVMPNHVHAILIFDKPLVAPLHATASSEKTFVEMLHTTPPLQKQMSAISPKKGSLSSVIRSYKSAVTKDARKIDDNFAWQSLFYDHIIRDSKSHDNIQHYIADNPLNWENDELYL